MKIMLCLNEPIAASLRASMESMGGEAEQNNDLDELEVGDMIKVYNVVEDTKKDSGSTA
jgi:hypothetical protein